MLSHEDGRETEKSEGVTASSCLGSTKPVGLLSIHTYSMGLSQVAVVSVLKVVVVGISLHTRHSSSDVIQQAIHYI